MSEQKRFCSICQRPFADHDDEGHNAQPVNARRCCADCNRYVVIPARINIRHLSDADRAAWRRFQGLEG
jgi:hypothetical protein